MSSNAQLVDLLCGVSTTNPINGKAAVSEANRLVEANALNEPTNVAEFPQRDRIQDVILRLALKGQTSLEISETVGKSVEQVEKVLRAEWATQELEKIAKESPENQDSLRNFIRIHSFAAVQAVVGILSDPKVTSTTKLQAARTILEYSITPAKMVDQKAKTGNTLDPEKLNEESNKLDSEIKRLEQVINKPI